MANFRHLKLAVSVVVLSGLTGCQNARNISNLGPSDGQEAREKREVAWINRQGLVQASPEEVATARAGEISFVGTKASIPGQSLGVVFKKGTVSPVGGVGVRNTFTTTSFYEVRNTATGKTLAKTASTIATGISDQQDFNQKVWVSPSGGLLLIHETWCGGDCAHDTYALATQVSDCDVWEVKYLEIPQFDGFNGLPDKGTIPMGFSGDELILDPLLTGKAFKKKLSEIKEAGNPLPFSRG